MGAVRRVDAAVRCADELATKLSPTVIAYGELELAFRFYNEMLFGNDLPSCLITLQGGRRRVLGHYCCDRFGETRGNGGADEIRLNPQYFRTSGPTRVMQTFVHEMTHHWQAHNGRCGRGGYHNKQWGGKMKAIGLYPSNTGAAGGREIGRQMMDYVIEGGRFETVTRELLDAGFAPSYYQRDEVELQIGGGLRRDGTPGWSGKRVKFSCPVCPETNAWGKFSLHLVCGICSSRMRSCQPGNGRAA